ncbi:hypothetical protein JKP75_12535 [Blastococcus sp. TML/M2B]|uniref:hypothetical protein n=1 Tax=Blastococcus sp. TML/M2B TaxID=2798727 RepID=UPI00190B928D|nr:hypothetical protein [Blastococcus sp. TML/M2B]MBN1093312.1 hypothetical protein [Blastococcus sp. TML/M2B]
MLVLAAPAGPAEADQTRAFCAFLATAGVEAWLESLTSNEPPDLQRLLEDTTVSWVLVVASTALPSREVDVPPGHCPALVPVVLPGGRAEDLPCWARPEGGAVVPVTDFSAEGAAPLLGLLLPPASPNGHAPIRPSGG